MEMKTKMYQPTEKHTAENMGSGTLAVLATPAVICFVENFCAELADTLIAPSETTVGIEMNLTHVKASLVTQAVTVGCVIEEVTAKTIHFSFTVYVADEIIASGQHKRAIIEPKRFLSRVSS